MKAMALNMDKTILCQLVETCAFCPIHFRDVDITFEESKEVKVSGLTHICIGHLLVGEPDGHYF